MIITCEACSARFRLDDSLIKPEGTKLRCAKCRRVFTAHPENPTEPEAAPLPPVPPPSPESHASGRASATSPESSGEAVLHEDPPSGDAFADLDRLDFSLDTASPDAPPSGPGGLDALDFEIDPQPRATLEAEGIRVNLDMLDMSLETGMDTGVELREMRDIPQPVPTEEKLEELELLLDGPETEPTAAFTATEPTPSVEETDAGDELELDLSLNETPDEAPVEFDLDTDATADITPDDGIDFVLEEEEGEKADFEDFEFELEKDVPAPPPSEEAPQFDEIEFELEEDPVSDTREPSGKAAPKFDEIEFTLEEDSEDTAKPQTQASTGLEDFDFELEMESEAAEDEPMEAPSASARKTGGLGFDVEDTAPETIDELSLDFDMASELEGPEMGMSLEVEIPEEPVNVPESAASSTARPPGPENHPRAEQNLTDAFAKDTEKRITEQDVQAIAAAARIPERLPSSAPLPKVRRTNPVTILLLLLLLVGALGGGFFYLQNNRITLPYIGEVGNVPKAVVQDPGNLKISTEQVTHEFITNARVGRVLVISGRVRNGYRNERSRIYLLGKLYGTDKKVTATQRFYAGNLLTQEELETLDITKIEARLNKPAGDRNRNMNLRPGQSAPFMVVFSKLPDGLSEFTIEVLRSVGPGKK